MGVAWVEGHWKEVTASHECGPGDPQLPILSGKGSPVGRHLSIHNFYLKNTDCEPDPSIIQTQPTGHQM